MQNKIIISGIISGIILCVSYICFAGEKEELQLKEAYYQKTIQCAQYEIIISQSELKIIQNRLQEIVREENNKSENKKEEIKK